MCPAAEAESTVKERAWVTNGQLKFYTLRAQLLHSPLCAPKLSAILLAQTSKLGSLP